MTGCRAMDHRFQALPDGPRARLPHIEMERTEARPAECLDDRAGLEQRIVRRSNTLRLARMAELMVLVGVVAMAVTSCVPGRTGPEPAVSSLVVRNRSFFDVNVYSLPSASASPLRLGTVVGSSSVTFSLRSHELQPGGFLVVQIHPIGTRSVWTSDIVAVDAAVLAILEVNVDAFGDCSRSSLYTIVTRDSLGPPPH